MDNKEKAMEIAIKNSSSVHRLICMRVDYNYEDCEKSAMEMAKWKDEQELKFLQELCVHSNLAILFEKMQNRIKELEATLNL